MLTNTHDSYGWVARLLHWLMAVAVIALFGIGLYMTGLGYYDPLYKTLPWWHKSVGLCVLALIGVRLLWRLTNVTPAHLATHTRLEIVLGRLVHIGLYALLLVICISGYLISTAKGRGIDWFGIYEVPAMIEPFERQGDLAGDIHLIAAWVLIGLVILHAAAALKHHFIDKDNTLIRMTRG